MSRERRCLFYNRHTDDTDLTDNQGSQFWTPITPSWGHYCMPINT